MRDSCLEWQQLALNPQQAWRNMLIKSGWACNWQSGVIDSIGICFIKNHRNCIHFQTCAPPVVALWYFSSTLCIQAALHCARLYRWDLFLNVFKNVLFLSWNYFLSALNHCSQTAVLFQSCPVKPFCSAHSVFLLKCLLSSCFPLLLSFFYSLLLADPQLPSPSLLLWGAYPSEPTLSPPWPLTPDLYPLHRGSGTTGA